jgi:hypothetical protein
VSVTESKAKGDTKTISIMGHVGSFAQGWDSTSVTAAAIHQGTKVVLPEPEVAVAENIVDGKREFTVTYANVPDGTYTFWVQAYAEQGMSHQTVCSPTGTVTMTNSTAPAFTARGTISLTATRLQNPTTSIECSGATTKAAGWDYHGVTPVTVRAWPTAGGVRSYVPSAPINNNWGTETLTDLPANCNVIATLDLDDGTDVQTVASDLLQR